MDATAFAPDSSTWPAPASPAALDTRVFTLQPGRACALDPALRGAFHAHRGLAPDALDLELLASAWQRGGALLFARPTWVCGPRAARLGWRVVPAEAQLACTVAVPGGPGAAGPGSTALLHALAIDAARAVLVTRGAGLTTDEHAGLASVLGADAAGHLAALLAVPAAAVVLWQDAPADRAWLAPLVEALADRPFVLASGDTARLHDMLSPYARALAPALRAAAPLDAPALDADRLYAAIDALCAQSTEAVAERVLVEADQGFTRCGPVTLVELGALRRAVCDTRLMRVLSVLGPGPLVLAGDGPDAVDTLLEAAGTGALDCAAHVVVAPAVRGPAVQAGAVVDTASRGCVPGELGAQPTFDVPDLALVQTAPAGRYTAGLYPLAAAHARAAALWPARIPALTAYAAGPEARGEAWPIALLAMVEAAGAAAREARDASSGDQEKAGSAAPSAHAATAAQPPRSGRPRGRRV